ncbi:MAG: alpha/beta hydrolase family protein, partial [Bacteroidales bacterium]|nr:alpha/beta hydrolase family protein [Bacteroidales bacterium]
FCPEIEAGAALCWMTLKSTCADPPTASDYSMMIPSLRSRYDFPDIARWLSPKPFFFLAGTQDRLFPAESVAQAYDIMQDIYGMPSALRTEFFDGPHHCGLAVQERITAFLDSTLQAPA